MGLLNFFIGKTNRKEDNVLNDSKTKISYDLDEYSSPDLIGKTIDEVKEEYGDYLHLPEDNENLIAKTNNSELNDDYMIQEGNHIKFIKIAGKKGSNELGIVKLDMIVSIVIISVFLFTLGIVFIKIMLTKS